MIKYKSISLIGGTLLLSTLTANGQKKNTQPNILFILCDDMGYGDLGCYGQPFIRTPHIDTMANEGMRFTQAYAGSPVSAPSRASFMTGQHSGHCEVRGNSVQQEARLLLSVRSISVELKNNRYGTKGKQLWN